MGGAVTDATRTAGRARRRALGWALAANATFLVVEAAAGLLFGSLALLADAAHMLSDVAALTITLVAERLVDRPATTRHSYGLQRAEVLGAQANGLLLVGAAAYVFIEGVQRLREPAAIEGGGLLIVALAGLAVNLGSAWLIARSAGRSLGMRGALTHMLADAAGSAGAVLAGIAVLAFGAVWADAVVAMGIGLLVVWAAFRLLRDATHVLLEGTPRGLDVQTVESAVGQMTGVESVHHVHLWNLSSDVPAMSAHVVLAGPSTLHDAQARGDEIKGLLAGRFGIVHATLELECHDCEPPVQASGQPAAP